MAPSLENMVVVDNLNVEYRTKRGRVKAVVDASFQIGRGEALGIVGESGAGKTTLASAILNILPINASITSGQVFVDGKDILALEEETLDKQVRWKVLSYVPQGSQNALDPIYRVRDRFLEVARVHSDMSDDEALGKASELLSLVGVERSKLDAYPWELSGGQKQRIMIAMALFLDPKVVVFDEPTTALDTVVQAQIIELLNNLRGEKKLTALYISHDISVIANVADTIGVMYAGRIVELGGADIVLSNPLHPYTRGLLKSIPDITSGEGYTFISGLPPDPLNPPPGCPFHPRCPLATEMCKQVTPPMVNVAGRQVSCHVAVEREVT